MKRHLRVPGLVIATVFGAGYVPVAPGTAGSLVAAAVFTITAPSTGPALVWAVVFSFLGYWGSRRGMAEWGKDPSRVVADEFAGCWIACMGAPAEWGIPGLATAFILFRMFDIFKPWPVSVFDRMDSAEGIMLDDLAAGIISAAVLLAAWGVAGNG